MQGCTGYVTFQDSIQKTFMEAFAQHSIEGSLNLNDMLVIVDAVLESFILGCGSIPWHSFKPHIITDHYAWCVNKKGNMYNYPDNQLIAGKKGTTQVVRRLWDAYLVAEDCCSLKK